MFARLHEIADPVIFTFDGVSIRAERGQTLATALLAGGVDVFRWSVVGGVPRAPYCLMGVCFDCLVTVDGVQNRQSCLIEVRQGMDVRSQAGGRQVNTAGVR
ncbi:MULTISPECIES: (2Fe-2S)-binding protein [unclassified Mesorhizobium]|uniref:(2Fe-2S)-binding protein n=1 Tax=unclassified Mesorhizobium TaxID=325217 RepID=UPI00112E1690|nr:MULTISPECIES: (2Fe-2S)-binding protein [unclassified Mesorhizobium]TPL02144.1 (2Fe-2S)-binding protein [Mesorhizobium sp. B2-4-16]TPL78404.1 (2Fe-2S)-binding protein [Mesorhizobium sp. B2-4-3]